MNEKQYHEYLDRLNLEYREYMLQLSRMSPQEIFEKAGEIFAMKQTHDYLRSAEIPDAELEYAMTALHPMGSVASQHEAFQSVLWQDNPVALTVHDIYANRLFSDGDTDLYMGRVPICFHRKVSSVSEILSLPRNRDDHPFQIEKVIELSAKEFTAYSNMLLTATPSFIQDNQDLMYVDNNEVWHCLLVHDKASHRGILVEADGYDYARYSAYVGNTRELDLTGIPVEDHTRKHRGKQDKLRQPER